MGALQQELAHLTENPIFQEIFHQKMASAILPYLRLERYYFMRTLKKKQSKRESGKSLRQLAGKRKMI
jgi:hypothetical protein